jgi:sugar phosphate isomerase/epimerase
MIIALNETATMYCNLLTDIRIAKEVGFGGIEMIHSKLYRYLDTGHTPEKLVSRLDGFPVVGLGFLSDIERQEKTEYGALLEECEKLCSTAESIGCRSVLLVTGPLAAGVGNNPMYTHEIAAPYRGLIGKSWTEICRLTAKNLRALAAIGKRHQIEFYLEALSWTPLHSLEQTLQVLAEAGEVNIGLIIDFWHHFTSGTSPEKIAKLDKNLIKGVHFCDSLSVTGSITQELRNVWTGAGAIPLQEWVDAVKATGYDGWWSCELFSFRHYELDPWETARNLRGLMEYLIKV